MSETITCPRCGKQTPNKSSKTWTFHKMTVLAICCQQCKKSFNCYLNPDGSVKYTIPKKKET